MNITFDHVVDIVQKLSLDEKEEVKSILERSIIEQRREAIYRNHLRSMKELKQGKIKFTRNLNELKRMMAEE